MTTGATGRADIGVDWFKCPAATTSASCPTLMGTVSTAGLNATRVEVRQGAPGQTGPVIASLIQTRDGVWEVPPDTTLTHPQHTAYLNGHFYINVDSASHRHGELRAQLEP